MKKSTPPASPDAYLTALSGWQAVVVRALREGVRKAAELEERIKWGHLVYFSHGPVLLIRAEEERVLFGFWRGQRLRDIEPRLKAGGKYEMATMTLSSEADLNALDLPTLVSAAISLNESLGDPTDLK